MPKVVYWNNQPTPYVVARFNAIAQQTSLDFEAWFDVSREADRSWDVDPAGWSFAWRMLSSRPAGGSVSRLPVPELREVRPDLFVCGYDRAGPVLGAIVARALASRLALRALPAYAAQTTPSHVREFAWRFVFRTADAAKVPGPDGRAFARRYGMPGWRTRPVTQSVDVDLYASRMDMPIDERLSLRHTWGKEIQVWFVYVGRVISSKGLQQLFDAWEQARTEPGPRRGLLIVGDGQDEDHFRARTLGWSEVRWLGFVQPIDLPVIYAAADCLVFPTLGDPNGLVVEEALAAGLPVIASDAAGDIRMRLEHTGAGVVVNAGDVSGLVDAMNAVVSQPERLADMADRAHSAAAKYAPAAYANDFEAFVRHALQIPRRRNLTTFLARVCARAVLLCCSRGRPAAAVHARGEAC